MTNYFEDIIALVSTDERTQNGIILPSYNVIVSSYYGLEGKRQILVRSPLIGRKLANVLFVDPFYSVSVFRLNHVSGQNISLEEIDLPLPGQHVKVVTRSFSRGIVEYSSVVVKTVEKQEFFYFHITLGHDVDYIFGSLVVSLSGTPLGIAVRKIGNERIEVLPFRYLKALLVEFGNYENTYAFRCPFCREILTEELVTFDKCAFCGEVLPPSLYKESQKVLSREVIKIENVIRQLNYQPQMTYLGKDFWEIEKSGTNILFYYDRDNNSLVIYSTLVSITGMIKNNRIRPEDKIKIMSYLLKENNEMKYTFFSVNDQRIILSSFYIDMEYVTEQALTRFVRDIVASIVDYKHRLQQLMPIEAPGQSDIHYE